MIQCVSLDRIGKDKYVIVKGIIDLKDYSQEDKVDVLKLYGYTAEDICDFFNSSSGNDVIAECILEQNILEDPWIVEYANSFEEAKEKIRAYIERNEW
jgi:hypothetical protein